jgi:DNA-binding beta-propeller fold protein YncE
MQKRIVAVLAVVLLLAVVAIGTTYSQQVASKADTDDVVMFSDISADGKVAVFSGQCFTCPEDYFHMVVFDPANNKAEKIDDIGPNPWSIAVTADGKKAYVAAFGEGGECPCSIGVYDLEKKEKSKIELGGKAPQGIDVSPDGSQIYYTDVSRGGGLRGIDAAKGEENYDFLIQGYLPILISLSADGKTGYLTGIGAGNATIVKVVDLAGKKELATIETGFNTRGEIHGAAVSKDGKTMVVTESSKSGSKAAVIDLAAGKVKGTVEVGAYPQEAAISPDGKTAYVVSLNGKNLTVIDLEGVKASNPVDIGCGAVGVQVAADGKSLYVGCMKEKQILTVTL